jgi:predicted amidohydrolase YtcJ
MANNIIPGMIDAPVIPAVNAVPGTVANTDGTTFPAVTPPVGQAATYNSAQRTVDPTKETVAGQMKGLIDENSPTMQMARTSANQQMNSRGLFNSSLAVTASDQAAYAAALPIAQADASVYDTNAKQNLAYQNEALKTNTAGINDMTGKNLSATVDAMKSNMDAAMKTQLATIEADYKTTMQNSATASEMYKQTVKNISDIQANKDMTLAAKQAAVDNQFYLMKQGFEIAGAIGNMNLGELLNFSAAPAVV